MLADSHCHLENNEKIYEIIERAKEAGVGFILDAGGGIDEIENHLDICSRFENVWTAAGVHPHQAKEYEEMSVSDILKAAEHEKVIAIGETGLDYFYDFAPKNLQIEVFKKNIEAAQITGKPLIIHNRNSDEDMIHILSESFEKKEFKAVVHCYSSSWELAEKALELGFYISASGIITFNSSQEIRDNFAKIPLERLLVETDSPYLAPVPKRGKVNEPANVVFTAQKLAEIKNVSFEDLAKITTKNFLELFKI